MKLTSLSSRMLVTHRAPPVRRDRPRTRGIVLSIAAVSVSLIMLACGGNGGSGGSSEITGSDEEGFLPESCGGRVEGQVAVDCTVSGDTDAMCVFGDHCSCSEGFACANGSRETAEGSVECAPEVTCVPDEAGPSSSPDDPATYGDEDSSGGSSNSDPQSAGGSSSSGGAPSTGDGDGDSNGDGDGDFVADPPAQEEDNPDLVGFTARSCGATLIGDGTPIDCTAYGDSQSLCVFGNHCACSEGFACAEGQVIAGNECSERFTCVPVGAQ